MTLLDVGKEKILRYLSLSCHAHLVPPPVIFFTMSCGIPGLISRIDGQLLAFVSTQLQSSSTGSTPGVCSNAVILIPGLTDGIMSMCYTQQLNTALLSIDYSLVQINISSSFYQFGFQSLEQDKKDIAAIVKYLKNEYKFNKIILCGHSTGCQDILFLLRYGNISSLIDGVVLQGGVSDRDGIMGLMAEAPEMLSEARELERAGKVDHFLTLKHCNAPITAARFLSLAGRLTDDDMFSIDLTEEELAPILNCVKVPILLVYSGKDEYVPDIEGQRVFANRMVKVLKESSPLVELEYIEEADHGLSTGSDAFVKLMINFINKQ